MAHECPVCEAVAPDGEHLAHHLAIVAMTRGGDHEDWLDERAPGWSDAEPGELAAVVLEHAAEVEHGLDGVAEERGPARPSVDPGDVAEAPAESPLDEETAAILAEARELTRRMQEGTGEDEPGPDADAGEPDSDASADGRDATPAADAPGPETDTDE